MRYIRSVTRKALRILSIAAFSLVISGSQQAFAGDYANGEKLFKGKCTACHKMDKKLTGPALVGALDRQPDMELLRRWIRNSSDVINVEKNQYYVDLFNEYNQTAMTSFQALKDEELDDLITYIGEWTPPPPDPGDDLVTEAGPKDTNYLPWIIVLIVIFLVMIRTLGGVRRSLVLLAAEKEDREAEPELTMMQATGKWIMGHKFQFTLILLFFTFGGMVDGWYVLKGVGVSQEYAPEQPIKFSHKIHAGDNKIACEYCHHSAEKGKNAGIPSVNVCMNCHRGVQEGKLYGEEEIGKIHKAAGFDAETNSYTKDPEPIKWVRIHNLPDFAYFNHSQHVVVGKQKCQTCHGEVESFDYPMHQHAELTMGWCVNCHRETEVKMEDNPYYDTLHKQLMDKHRKDPEWKATVKDIGGLECAKCHY